jgi:hypothetical protein
MKSKSYHQSEMSVAAKKIKSTLFWGVKIEPLSVFSNDEIQDVLKKYPKVIPLKNIHVTLLYVGRKSNSDEDKIIPFKYNQCHVICKSICFNDDAVVLRIDSLRYDGEDQSIIDPNRPYHITLALRESVKAKDSIKAMTSEGTELQLMNPIAISGTILCYK